MKKYYGLSLVALLTSLFLSGCAGVMMPSFGPTATPQPSLPTLIPTPTDENATTIRLYNHSDQALTDVTVAFAGDPIEIGDLPAQSASDYYEVEAAFPIANITAVLADDLPTTIDDQPLVAQPYDYVGVNPLLPGHYTYQVDIDLATGLLEITLLDFVFEVEATGGLCVYGGCYTQLVLYADGSLIAFDGSGKRSVIHIDPALVLDVQNEIAAADFDALTATPFTDTCPIAYDGSEYHYSFSRLGVVETISSCEYVVDVTQPPYRSIQAILDVFYLEWASLETENARGLLN